MASSSAGAQDMAMKLAIALFEEGYAETRIEAALKHVNTQAQSFQHNLEEAKAWLRVDAGELPSSATESLASTSASALVRQPKENRKRVNKKTTDAAAPFEESSLAQSLIREAPSPMHLSTHQRVDLESQGNCGSDSQRRELEADSAVPSWEHTRLAVESLACEFAPIQDRGVEARCVKIRPLRPEEATAWWEKASASWPQLRLGKTASSSKRPSLEDNADLAPGTPVKKLRGSQLSPSGSDASRRGAQDSAASRDATGVSTTPYEAASKTYSPSSSSVTRVGEFATRSAPALLSSPRSSQVSKRESITPGTSPRAQMRYNTVAEVCAICCDEFEKGRAVRLGCRHGWYCTDCMEKHAEARLEVGAAHIACPECVAPIAECNLRRLLPATIIERLLARSLEQAVSSIADLRACPTPDCPMRFAIEEGEEPRLLCPECKKESCLQCGAQPYHKGLTCEEFQERARARGRRKAEAMADDSFRQWMQETGTKQCPTCNSAVTKEDLDAQNTQYKECHKMICRQCNAKFCFKCLKLLTDTFTCGCSNDKHGFCDPRTGKRVEHMKLGRTAAKTTQKPAVKHKGRR